MPAFLYQGMYGPARRNDPYRLEQCNPLPQNKMDSCTGDAGKDGYTRYMRTPREQDYIGRRPTDGGTPVFQGPRSQEEQ